ncbi:MAG: DUF2177 family protein [Pseudobdellovibrionaceae bacterium]
MDTLKLFGVSLLSFAILDTIWLGALAKKIYIEKMAAIGRIENGQFHLEFTAVPFVYLLMSAAIVFFVLPRLQNTSITFSFFVGAFMGLIVYGVYDMTNMATLKDWSWSLSLIDMTWGCTIFGLVTLVTKYTGMLLSK